MPEYYQETDYVNNYVFIEELSKAMKEDDLLIPGSAGAAAEITMQAFKVKNGQRVFNFPGLGSMGFGIASAIGVCIASGRRTICIEGDGSFAMNTQELETIRRLNLPIKIFVLNNGGYASIRNTQRNYFKRLTGCDLVSGVSLPNIGTIADAYGIEWDIIRENEHIDHWIKQALEIEGPYIVEVMVNPDQQTMPRAQSKLNADGTMESRPLDDMWPPVEDYKCQS